MPTFRAREPVSGYTHLAGLCCGLLALPFLVLGARGQGALWSNLAYGASMVLLYGASSAYHLLPCSAPTTLRLRQLDHSAIFLFIAGSCTPVFWHGLSGDTRAFMLTGIWAVALLGIVLRLCFPGAPRSLYTLMYVAMGWSVVVKAPALAHAISAMALTLVVASGIVYTLGAIVYATKRPDPFPKVFGFHEIWHLFVLAGSALHYGAIVML